jgi:hypothetical protein
MKAMALIILLLYLLQPLACLAHSCDLFSGNPDTMETPGKSGNNPHNQDADSCDSTNCCEENIYLNAEISVIYSPLVTVIIIHERYQELPKVVIPIFVPPQRLA